MKKAKSYLQQISEESHLAHKRFLREHGDELIEVAGILGPLLANGNKILIMGNGGSAADAQHMAAEFVGRLLKPNRMALPAIALTTDSSNLTAIANDFGYDEVFARQLEALAQPLDVVFAISTSGNSPSILNGAATARRMGCIVISLTGGKGGKLKNMSDTNLNVSSGKNSCRIQEVHIFAIHAIVDILERFYL